MSQSRRLSNLPLRILVLLSNPMAGVDFHRLLSFWDPLAAPNVVKLFLAFAAPRMDAEAIRWVAIQAANLSPFRSSFKNLFSLRSQVVNCVFLFLLVLAPPSWLLSSAVAPSWRFSLGLLESESNPADIVTEARSERSLRQLQRLRYVHPGHPIRFLGNWDFNRSNTEEWG